MSERVGICSCRRIGVAVLLAMVGAAGPTTAQNSAEARCALPESRVIRQDGNTVMHLWELSGTEGVWFSVALPDAPGYSAYRAAIQAAGGDLLRPIFDPLKTHTEVEREIVRREEQNIALMYSGGGRVEPIRCLEAALFAFQDARYSALTQPTEFIAHVLRRADLLRVYFGASDTHVPPKHVYGFAEVGADVDAGWEYLAVLHNHTVQTLNGRLALGVPAPSTSDVQLFRGIAQRLGLREVWVTNGMYTGVIPSGSLHQFRTRE